MAWLCDRCDTNVADVHDLSTDSHWCNECAEVRLVVRNFMSRHDLSIGVTSELLTAAYAERNGATVRVVR